MRTYVMAAAAGLSLLGTAGWANVQSPVMPGQTGPNFNAAMDEANSSAKTHVRAVYVGAASKSAVLERSAELGGL
jgi:hypothetical protein